MACTLFVGSMPPNPRATQASFCVFADSDDDLDGCQVEVPWQEALQQKTPMEQYVSSKSAKSSHPLVLSYRKRKRASAKLRVAPHQKSTPAEGPHDDPQQDPSIVPSFDPVARLAVEKSCARSLRSAPLDLRNAMRASKLEVHLGRKTQSLIKPARNVGPQLLESHIRGEIEKLADECATRLIDAGHKLCPSTTASVYAHPFQSSSGSVSLSKSLSTSSSQRESICRRVQALMQRQPSRPPLWAIPRDLPGCSSKDLDYLILYCMAFNSAANPMCKEKSTEAKCLQCKRIRTGHVQRAQAAAIVMTELATALVRRHANCSPPLPYAQQTFDPCDALVRDGDYACVVASSTSLQCASMPCKMRPHSLVLEAKRLASLEINGLLNATMRCEPEALREICDSVMENRAAKHNAFWSSIALICIANAHPATRRMICLDALNLEYVNTLSIYACKEQTRRSNYANTMMKKILKVSDELESLQSTIASLQTRERELTQSIRDHRKTIDTSCVVADTVLETLLAQHVKVRNRLFVKEQEYHDALHVVDSAKTVRRRNGLDEEENDPDDLCNSRANLGTTPADVLHSWIKILNGHFIYVMNAMSTVENDAELSTITNVQIQLARTEAQFEHLQQLDASKESQLTERLWTMVQRVVGMMQRMVHTINLSPIFQDGEWKRVDETSKKPRVLLHAAKTPPKLLQPSARSEHRVLWTNECILMPDHATTDAENGSIDLLLEVAQKREMARSQRQPMQWRMSSEAVTEQFSYVMPREHAPTRSMLIFRTYTVDDPQMHLLANRIIQAPEMSHGQMTQEMLESTHAPSGCCPFICLGLRSQWIAFNLNQRRRATNLRLEFGASLSARLVNTTPCEREHSIPTPMAAISEFQAKACDGMHDCNGTPHQPYSVAYTVCASNATRLVDLVRHGDDAQAVVHALSMLAVGMVHIGSCSQFGSMCTADGMISLVNNGQRIQQRADNSTMLNLTAFGLYAGGRSNLVRSMNGTSWEGCYPAWVDAGVTPLGVDARNYSDDRNPGTFYMSAETSKRYAEAFARKWLQPISDQLCDQRPTPTRGVPLALVPGVHTALNAYDAALRATHAKLGLPEHEQCEVLVFPISPYAQQLGCIVPNPEWSTDKLPVHVRPACDGCTINPDNTDPGLAVVHSQCLQPPMQLFPGDNLLENGLEEVGSFLAMASYLASLAMWCGRLHQDDPPPELCVSLLHALMDNVIRVERTQNRSWQRLSTATGPQLNLDSQQMVQLGVRAAVALNAMYPSQHAVGEPIMLPAFEQLVIPCLERGQRPSEVNARAAKELEDWWCVFATNDHSTCAWHQGVSNLLTLMIRHDGRHALSSADCAQLRDALHNSVCASYWVYSRNGECAIPASNPLHGITSTDQIQRHHVDGTFVVRHTRAHSRGVELSDDQGRSVRAACGGIVGVKFFQMQQLFTMLEARGPSAVPQFQLYRCGGQMLIRQSSDASNAPQATGGARRESDKLKRFLCALFERDVDSQGTIEERRDVCLRCERAWDRNLETFLNIFVEIERPKPLVERLQGDALKPSIAAPQEDLWTSTTPYAAALERIANSLAGDTCITTR